MMKFLVVFAVSVGLAKGYMDYYPAWEHERTVMQAVQKASAGMPMVYNNAIRMESIRYEHDKVYASGTLLDAVPVNDNYKKMFAADMKEMYCGGIWKKFAQSKVPLDFTLRFESVFYRDIEWVFSETPQTCRD